MRDVVHAVYSGSCGRGIAGGAVRAKGAARAATKPPLNGPLDASAAADEVPCNAKQEDWIQLHVQYEHCAQTLIVTIKPTAPLAALLRRACARFGIVPGSATFKVNGQYIHADTPSMQLGLKNGAVVEVREVVPSGAGAEEVSEEYSSRCDGNNEDSAVPIAIGAWAD